MRNIDEVVETTSPSSEEGHENELVEESATVVKDGEDEEEVELFSADALTTRSSSIPQLVTTLSERMVSSPRRCVSRELLEQMPALSISARYYEVSIAKPFGAFHLMQLIEKSIQVGALFSPKLYVPKEIWQQDRVKLAGVSTKVEVFQALKQGVEKITMTLPLTSNEAKMVFLKECDRFFEFAKVERSQLSRSFPFILVEKGTEAAAAAAATKTETAQHQASSSTAAAGIGKLTNMAVGFGRMVKKQAIAAVERVGAAQPVAISFDDLEEYAATLCMFFNSTRNLEHIIGLRAGADGTQEEVNILDTTAVKDPDVLVRLKELAIFLDEVVVELVMRDIQTLLETYLRRITQQFGEFTVEHAMMKEHHSAPVNV